MNDNIRRNLKEIGVDQDIDYWRAPSIKGTNQFPNPPIRIGITIKKIITKA